MISLFATAFVRAERDDDPRLAATLASLTAIQARAEVEVVVDRKVDLDRARGTWITCLSAGERLLPDWVDAVAANLDADIVYGDSILENPSVSHLSPKGETGDDHRRFRPAWSPTLFDGLAYFGSGAAIRRELLDGTAPTDAAILQALAATRTAAVRHVDRLIVVERDDAAPSAALGAPLAASAALATIIIPTRDRLDLLRPCLDSIRRHTADAHEILIVDNDSREPETLRFLAAGPARVVRFPGDFHFAAMNNEAARQAHGSHVVFLNNDTVVTDDGWLRGLLGPLEETEVGAVGAELLYPDGGLQHAGMLVHPGARVDHVFSGVAPSAIDHPWAVRIAHEVAAVTAACMATRRDLFLRLGGFDESLRVAFNDVDLCFRLRQRGYRVIWTPAATLTHHECASRPPLPPLADEVAFRSRWAGSALDGDPYLAAVRRELGDGITLPRGEVRRPEID